MLSLLPNLQRVVLKSDNETRKPLRKLKDAARLVAGGLARNEKASLRFFRCEVDCGPEAIVALLSRHCEL